MPGCKGVMLFEYRKDDSTANVTQALPEYKKPSLGTTVNGNSSPMRNGSPNGFDEEDASRHDLPPDSDSEGDSSDSQTDHSTSPRQRNNIHTAFSRSYQRDLVSSSTQTTPSRPSFTPFIDPSSDPDDELESKPIHVARRDIQTCPSASKKVGLSVRSLSNWDTEPPIIEDNGVAEKAGHPENPPVDQERDKKKLERDIVVGMSNLDMFTEEIGTCMRPPVSIAH